MIRNDAARFHRESARRSAAAALLVLLCPSGAAPTPPTPPSPPATAHAAPSAAVPGPGPRQAPTTATTSPPVRLRIPAIGVDAPVVPVGLTADRSLVPPPYDHPDQTGWFDGSPRPGDIGPSVIVGHLDVPGRPAVFFRLKEIRVSDAIEIVSADGSEVTFEVTRVVRVDKARFPTAEVYGDIDYAGLRLITCGGPFDVAERSYRDNVIVFAHATP